MAIFTFDQSHYLGTVRAVDTRRVAVCVESDEDLRKARVGQLAALQLPGSVDEWLIGIIAKVVKSTAPEELCWELGAQDSETAKVYSLAASTLPRKRIRRSRTPVTAMPISCLRWR